MITLLWFIDLRLSSPFFSLVISTRDYISMAVTIRTECSKSLALGFSILYTPRL